MAARCNLYTKNMVSTLITGKENLIKELKLIESSLNKVYVTDQYNENKYPHHSSRPYKIIRYNDLTDTVNKIKTRLEDICKINSITNYQTQECSYNINSFIQECLGIYTTIPIYLDD